MEACLLAVGGMSTGCRRDCGLWRDVHWLSGRLGALEGCLLVVGGGVHWLLGRLGAVEGCLLAVRGCSLAVRGGCPLAVGEAVGRGGMSAGSVCVGDVHWLSGRL